MSERDSSVQKDEAEVETVLLAQFVVVDGVKWTQDSDHIKDKNESGEHESVDVVTEQDRNGHHSRCVINVDLSSLDDPVTSRQRTD